jgi:hypothetical protein
MTLGQHMPEEQRVRLSLWHKGRVESPETRAKVSAAGKGRPAWNKGIPHSAESRAKMSLASKGKAKSAEHCAHISAGRWKGGRKATQRKSNAKQAAGRRLLGFVSLNAWFPGSAGHHVDNEQVIHMPKALHNSVYHNQHTGRGMAKINAIAYNYLFKQELNDASI